MTIQEQRDAVIKEALSWSGTPFHHHAGIKGVGVDCLHFLYAPFKDSKLIPDIEIPYYSDQWFAHRDENRLIEAILSTGAEEITEEHALPGDVVTAKVGRVYAHSGIIITPGVAPEGFKFVHANPHLEKVQCDYTNVYHLFAAPQHRPLRFFSLWKGRTE